MVEKIGNSNFEIRNYNLKVLALDIDGVLTDGTGRLTNGDDEEKRFTFHDLDAVTQARRAGLVVALITGEHTPGVDLMAKRFGIEHVIKGAKDKACALTDLSSRLRIPLETFCYIGDSDHDAPAISSVGLGLAPANATPQAKAAAHRLLSKAGGRGAVAEAVGLLLRLREESRDAAKLQDDLKRSVLESIAAHQRLLDGTLPVLVKVTQAFIGAIRSGHKILLFGNGGSAADAQHVAAELVGRFSQESEPWPAIALTTDTSVLTCVANDWEYAEIFSRQVRALAKPSDVVVGISTSGRSPNVLRGLKAGKDRGAVTIGFTGMDGSAMREHTDVCFCAPAKSTPRIQELHLVVWHAVCEMVETELMKNRI